MIDACRLVRRRVLPCLLATLLGLSGLAAAPPAAAARAASISITLDSITPGVAGPTTEPLTLRGDVVNTGGHAVELSQVELWLDRARLTSRVALADALKPGEHDGGPVSGAQAKLATTLPPGGRLSWRLTAPAKALGLRQNGVYPMSVVAIDDNGDRVGATRTALPWMLAAKDYAPTRIAMLWPLTDLPRLTGQGRVRPDGTVADPVLTDDGLAGSLTPNTGRLACLLTAGLAAQTQDHVPLTWAIDPDLLATVRAMTGPYRVGATGKPGNGQQVANAWLAEVKQAASGAGAVLGLPYADQDVSAIAHAAARNSRIDQRPDLSVARTLGGQVSGAILGRPVTDDMAWPGNATADSRVLAAVRAAGYNQVILGDTTAPAAGDPPFTPGGVARLGGLTAHVTDTVLDAVLAGDSHAPGAATLRTQRFLAETAMITEEAPNDQRTILVAPPRGWNPDPALVTGLLGALAHAPWLTPVSLGAGPTSQATSRAHQLRPQPDAGQLSAAYLSKLARPHSELSQLMSILATPPGRLTGPYQPAILRAESIAWRGRPAAATGFLDAVTANLRTLHNRVGINNASTLTLSGNSGSLPFTVVNDLEQPVTVKLSVVSLNSTRLDVDEIRQLTVPGGGRTQVKINVRNVVGPRVRIRARLLTKSGQEYGPAQQITVVSTNFGAIGLGIIFGAVALIIVVVAVRLRRRARAGARASGRDDAPPDQSPDPDPDPDQGVDQVREATEAPPQNGTDEKLTR